jgi:hypothetical protein
LLIPTFINIIITTIILNKVYLTKQVIKIYKNINIIYIMTKQVSCNKCNKTFSKSSNLKAHLNKKNPCTPRSTICGYCNKPFTTLSNLTRHLKDSCLKENDPYYKDNIEQRIQEMEVKLQHDKDLIDHLKEIAITQAKNAGNTNNINTQNNTNNNHNLTMNILTKDYIAQNFTGEPCIKSLDDYSIIKEGNLITEPHHEDDNIMFINTIVSQYERGKLVAYISNIIIAFYKKPDRVAEQSLWCSDLSRLKFLVRILPTNATCNKWVTDPSGITVKEKVILPLLTYIVKCIDEYGIKYPMKMITETDKFLLLGEIVTSIRNNSLTNNITKYIAPHFTLGKQLTIKK